MPSDFDGPSLGTNKVLPILGFDELPHPEDALKRLYQADTLRHGERILDETNKRNEERLQPARDAADDASYQAAEALEWGTRKMTGQKDRAFISDKES